TLEEAAKFALLSMDSTMTSNVTVGPPIDLLAYSNDELDITRHKRFEENDPGLTKIRTRWEQQLRQAVMKLPDIRFKTPEDAHRASPHESIEVVEKPAEAMELQPQQSSPRPPQ
ncbi:MAG: hypothetical protein ACREJC_15435, partial [Tepidisphaeraceae bacterium]